MEVFKLSKCSLHRPSSLAIIFFYFSLEGIKSKAKEEVFLISSQYMVSTSIYYWTICCLWTLLHTLQRSISAQSQLSQSLILSYVFRFPPLRDLLSIYFSMILKVLSNLFIICFVMVYVSVSSINTSRTNWT